MILREPTHEDIPAIARVHVDTWRTAYRGIVPDAHLAKLSYEDRENRWHQILNQDPESGNFTYVAEHASEKIVGFASGGPEREKHPVYKGELTAIYILQSHQGKGIGRRLMQVVAERLGRSQMHSMLAWVLVDNPACQFYTRLGGVPVREKAIVIGRKSLIEVAYGWQDISNLRSL